MKSPICVDANLVLRWLLPEDHSQEALSLLEEWKRQKTQLVAPSHLAIEEESDVLLTHWIFV
ncbi:hypothetical protein HKBW3C_00637 [Candidatus Hakubella thermalkaliphila]|nr:hypothetical protein HKBW3C_00637 [Candidatus Hakubella thermalkaliphila]